MCFYMYLCSLISCSGSACASLVLYVWIYSYVYILMGTFNYLFRLLFTLVFVLCFMCMCLRPVRCIEAVYISRLLCVYISLGTVLIVYVYAGCGMPRPFSCPLESQTPDFQGFQKKKRPWIDFQARKAGYGRFKTHKNWLAKPGPKRDSSRPKPSFMKRQQNK